ncbi:MAG TPA: EAL domain-containing protein [Burkholderiales bacterium]|nr:EAL domain-containing protein [Burkholderiales bacterium]
MKARLRILMVEDVEADADLALRELKRAGLAVESHRVDLETEFRRELRDFLPEVVLSDFNMPQFDGMSALAISREIAPDIPFIFLSGTIGEEYAIRALKNGAFDYVLKNNLVRLPPAVEKATQDSKARLERARAEQLRALEHSVTGKLAHADSVAVALEGAIRSVCEIEGWDCGRYFVPDEISGALRVSEAWGVPNPAVERFITVSRGIEFGPGVGLPGRILQSGQPLWSRDLETDSSVQQLAALARECNIHGTFGFPVISDGKTIGVLSFSSHRIREPDERLLQTIGVIGSQIGQFIQRKRAQEEQYRFRIAMDVSADMILLIDRASMRFVDVNDTACQQLGYSREELLKMGPQDVLPVNREELERSYDEMITDPSSSVIGGMYSQYRCKSGSFLPFESTRRIVRSGDTHIIAVISRDIRNRIAAEEALNKSNERFNLAVRATNDVVWDWDLATDELWWNENLTAAFGYLREDIGPGAKAWYDLIHSEDRDRIVSELHRVLELGDESWSDEYRFRRKDGSYAFVFDRGHVIRDAEGKATRMIGAKADVTARKQAEERLSYLAQFDTLSGLPNRHLFRDRLAQTLVQARRNKWAVGVMFVDLDRFKQVNDTLGHDAGDKLLKEAADRLTGCVRTGDAVGHFSGDEFGVVLSDLRRPGDAGQVARKIVEAVARPFYLDGQETYVTASVGITLFPGDGEEVDILIKNADSAMYRAKEEGRNNYQFFTRELNERALRRAETETALRRALERREFLLHYQLKADLTSRAICGFEALLRWQHPEKGLISPADFIPVLEDTGLIVPVGEWVLGEACRQIVAWNKAGLSTPPVAVNLSARQFNEEGLQATVRRILGETGIDPSLIQFELTESLLMKDPEGVARTLRELRESGVRFSVDDFGTGYSSLAYLKRFPLDALKIDRAFVRDVDKNPDDAAITLAIIGLAHSLKLKVIAEGVETRGQLDFLRKHGCDEMQGFYFAKPLPAAACTQALVDDLHLQA